MISNIMKGVWGISAIAAVLILGILGVQDVYGPEEPEKLNLGGTGYDNESGNFELKASSMYGIGTAADNTTFEIVATLKITDTSGIVDTIPHTAPIVPAGDPEPGSKMVPLEPILIPWNQDGSYSGTVDVETTAHLTKNGNKIGNSEDTRTDDGIPIGSR